MKKFLQFYLTFTLLILIEMITAVVYIRMVIQAVKRIGVLVYPAIVDTSLGYLLGNFLTFTSLSFAVIAQNHFALIFYFYFSLSILLSLFCYTPFSYRGYLQFTYLFPKLFEVIFVFYNSDLYSQKILFIRNRKIGSDLKLKKVLNIHIFNVVARTVAYLYIIRNIIITIFYTNTLKIPFPVTLYTSYFSFIFIDLSASFYEKYENIILKTISNLSILALLIINILFLVRHNKFFDMLVKFN